MSESTQLKIKPHFKIPSHTNQGAHLQFTQAEAFKIIIRHSKRIISLVKCPLPRQTYKKWPLLNSTTT